MQEVVQKLMSDKSQISIDLLISYLIFIVLIVYITLFIMNLITPYQDNFNYQAREEGNNWLYLQTKQEVYSTNDFNNKCGLTQISIDTYSLNYLIKSIQMPGNDYEGTALTRIYRREYDLIIRTKQDLTAKITIPYQITVNADKINTEADDELTITNDEYNNKIINLNLKSSETDEDEIIITTNSENPYFLTIDSEPQTNIQIGGLNLTETYCREGLTRDYNILEFYSIINDKGNSYLALISIKTWWLL